MHKNRRCIFTFVRSLVSIITFFLTAIEPAKEKAEPIPSKRGIYTHNNPASHT